MRVRLDPYFSNLIIAVVVCNIAVLAIDADLDPSVYPLAAQAVSLLDLIFLCIYGAEIVLKWLDSFTEYWQDGWNVFDFVVTVVVRPFSHSSPTHDRSA